MMFKNYFFYLNFNSWALFSSFSSLNFMMSMIIFFKYYNFNLILINLINLMFCMMIWWSMYSNMMKDGGMMTENISNCLKFSFLLFISSEVMFFFSLFWSYYNFFLSPTLDSGMKITSMIFMLPDLSSIPLTATFILLLSSVTVTVSHMFFNFFYFELSLKFLKITIVLGVMFTIFQYVEYSQSFFCMSDSFMGSIFYLLTGFHGIHVLIGTIYLFYVYLKFLNNYLNKLNFLMFELSSWYWHFVDIVWLMVFTSFYYLNL